MQKQAVVFNGQQVGIAVELDDRVRFIAVKFNVIDLDNAVFDTVTDIKRAITAHLSSSLRTANEVRL